jgi:polyhydroxyalkanoate synthesis regulator phasin
MNPTITRSLKITLSLTLSCWMGSALAQTDEHIEKFNREREAYFNEKLGLSETEAKAFWPVYNDFQNRKMKLAEDERNTFRYAHSNAENLSEKELTETLNKIRDLKQQIFDLEQEYYQKRLPEVLTPRKMLNLYKVEWDFRRHLIREIREKGQSGTEDKGRHGRSGGGSPGSGNPLPDRAPMELDPLL